MDSQQISKDGSGKDSLFVLDTEVDLRMTRNEISSSPETAFPQGRGITFIHQL